MSSMSVPISRLPISWKPSGLSAGEITKLRKTLAQFDLRSQIIVGSTCEILNVIEWLEAGAHIVTVVPHLLEGMLVHPYSKETVQQFLRDAARAEEMLKGSSA